MASRLPRELLDIVIDYLLEAEDDDQSSSLKTASLICRAFVVSSQSRLFATISLRAPPHKIKPHGRRIPTYFIPTNSKRGLKSSIDAFSRLTADSPHLLGYVRHLNLHGSFYPLHPPLPHGHSDWLNSQSHSLMTFLPNLAPTLRGFGMFRVTWNELFPEVQSTITDILKSELLIRLTIENSINLSIPVFAFCAHLQHLTLRTRGYSQMVLGNVSDSALTHPVSNHLPKPRLFSLNLHASTSQINWLSTKSCMYDISHLLELAVHLEENHSLAEIFQICSHSLESLEMWPPPSVEYMTSLFAFTDMSSLLKLKKAHFHIDLPTGSFGRNSLTWFNNLLKQQSQILSPEEIILECKVTYQCIPLDLSLFSETDSIIASALEGIYPALRSLVVLVRCDKRRYTYKVIETIEMRMPLLQNMGLLKVRGR